MNKKKISFAMTAYDEEYSIPDLIKDINKEIILKYTQYEFEITICDNGSNDNTYNVIESLKEEIPCIKTLSLTRNFGHQGGLLAALEACDGDAVIMMDADGQHPVVTCHDLISGWEAGYNIVNTKKIRCKFSFKSTVEVLFYFIMRKFTGMDLGEADFRLIDKVVKKNLLLLPEREKFIRGLVQWQGYKEKKISYKVLKRKAGKSKFSILKLFDFAFQGITSFSTKPLRLVASMGVILFIPSTLIMLWHIYIGVTVYFFSSNVTLPPGWLTNSILIMFFGSIQLLSVGILGEYIGRIYTEVKGRPLFYKKEDEHEK